MKHEHDSLVRSGVEEGNRVRKVEDREVVERKNNSEACGARSSEVLREVHKKSLVWLPQLSVGCRGDRKV